MFSNFNFDILKNVSLDNNISPASDRLMEINQSLNALNTTKPTGSNQFSSVMQQSQVSSSAFSNLLPNTFGDPNVKLLSPNLMVNLIKTVSNKYGVDPKLVNSVIKTESGYNLNAKSPAGAMGLMQLMPATAKELGVTDPGDPYQNVEGGTKYLAQLINKYNGNMILAIAAYNAGPGNVDKYGTIPPFKETQNYVMKVLDGYLSTNTN